MATKTRPQARRKKLTGREHAAARIRAIKWSEIGNLIGFIVALAVPGRGLLIGAAITAILAYAAS